MDAKWKRSGKGGKTRGEAEETELDYSKNS